MFLDFIKNLLKPKNAHNGLIDTLKKDHQKLFEIYTNISKSLQSNRFLDVQNSVKQFVNEYNKHILLEDTQLYVALEEKYKNRKTILRTIKDIEKDMNSITRAIKFFEKKYSQVNYDNRDIFEEELKYIGQVLTDRVQLEEERLYPLLIK
jgi:regulator of sigma D